MWSAGTHMSGVGCLSAAHFGSLSSSNKLALAHVHGGCRDLMVARGQVFKVFKILLESNLLLSLLANASHMTKLNLRSREKNSGKVRICGYF